MLNERTFRTGAIDINYIEGPAAGPPLLLLHGITQRWQEFIQILPALTQNYHVFAPDFRGHGKSGHARGSYHGEHYSQDILEFLDNVVRAPVVVFGHSLGGMVSLYLSAKYSSRIRAQAIGDSIIFGTDVSSTVLPSMFSQVRQMTADGKSYDDLRKAIPEMWLESPVFGRMPMKMLPGCDDAYLSAWARSLSQMDHDVLTMTLDGRAFNGWEPAELIKSIRCPTLLIQGDPKLGGLMTDEDVSRLKAACPNVQVARMNGIGHSLHMYQAEPVLRALTNFLSTLE